MEVVSLERLQNGGVYSRYAEGVPAQETVMFHGCKTAANEQNIMENGFQVKHCTSGGASFGTWFAYNADYSIVGFVYYDNTCDVRHIFVCVVSDRYVVLDNAIMRVVAQDCAYPLWLLRYKNPSSPPSPPLPLPLTVSSPFPPVRRARRRNPPVRVFQEVRGECWVRFSLPDET